MLACGWSTTQAEVAEEVGLKSGVYGRVERGMMMPSVPTLRRMCETLGISSDVLLSLGAQAREETAPVPPPGVGENPELSRIIHVLKGWPPERLALMGSVEPYRGEAHRIAGMLVCPQTKSSEPLRTAESAEVLEAGKRLLERGSFGSEKYALAI